MVLIRGKVVALAARAERWALHTIIRYNRVRILFPHTTKIIENKFFITPVTSGVRRRLRMSCSSFHLLEQHPEAYYKMEEELGASKVDAVYDIILRTF